MVARDDSPPARILIVDDSETILEYTKLILIEAGYKVKTHQDVWIAQKVADFHPDLILMDVIMKGSDGTVAAGALRDRKFSSGSLIVLHSSLPGNELRKKAELCLADGYIEKTKNPATLLSRVRRCLDRGDRRR